MVLKLQNAKDLVAKESYFHVLLYGKNGGGKTHFAATWPDPVFIVPQMARSEVRTIGHDDQVQVLLFESIVDMKNQIVELGKAIEKGRVPCRTIVFDNLTTTQMLFEDELKAAKNIDKLEWDDWSKFKTIFSQLMTSLHSWPVHVIWITHANSEPERVFTLMGSSKDFFPANCDLILYAEVMEVPGKNEAVYRIHGRQRGQWPARVRLPRSEDYTSFGYIESIPGELHYSPHYDDMAPVLGLPTLEQIEASKQK